jgi:hypothetical protein
MTEAIWPAVGTEDTVHNWYSTELFHLNQQELEQQAHHERLIQVAMAARRRNRKATRETLALRQASDAVGRAGGVLSERRSSVITGR